MPDRPFAIGDVVVIVGDHPWHGYTGDIREGATAQGWDWVVALRGTYMPVVGVSESQIRHV